MNISMQREDKDVEIYQLSLKFDNLDRISRLKTLMVHGIPTWILKMNEFVKFSKRAFVLLLVSTVVDMMFALED